MTPGPGRAWLPSRSPFGRAHIMGILNITPDSFSDGGQLLAQGGPLLDVICRRAEAMVQEGVAILDVGGESTRPGAQPVCEQEELARVIPVVEALHSRLDVLVSVDTSSPVVMREAVAAGAGMINDVRALQADEAPAVAARLGVPVCLMHMRGGPDTMQADPRYEDVVQDVERFLLGRVQEALDAGIARDYIVLDPGFGFGKNLEHNLALFNNIGRLAAWGYPLLVGVSRKAMVGHLTGRPVSRRAIGSAVLAALAVTAGACIVRAHDVPETADALRIVAALEQS